MSGETQNDRRDELREVGTDIQWAKPEIVEAYVESIEEGSDSEIAYTKNSYHDPAVVEALLPVLQENGTVVDVGCGNGSVLAKIRAKISEARLVGVDLPSMVHEAKKQDLEGTLQFVAASYEQLPFADNSIDSVISNLLFHWIRDSQRALDEIFRVLKPGSTAHITLIHPHSFHVGKWKDLGTEHPQYELTEDVDKVKEKEVYINGTVGPLIYYLRPIDTYKAQATQSGFSSVQIDEPTYNKIPTPGQECLYKYRNQPLYLFITLKK